MRGANAAWRRTSCAHECGPQCFEQYLPSRTGIQRGNTMITNVLRRTLFLASLIGVLGPAAVRWLAAPPPDNITLTGLVTCSLCLRSEYTHKTFTALSWAVTNVELGDDVMLVASGRTYRL